MDDLGVEEELLRQIHRAVSRAVVNFGIDPEKVRDRVAVALSDAALALGEKNEAIAVTASLASPGQKNEPESDA